MSHAQMPEGFKICTQCRFFFRTDNHYTGRCAQVTNVTGWDPVTGWPLTTLSAQDMRSNFGNCGPIAKLHSDRIATNFLLAGLVRTKPAGAKTPEDFGL